jgi:hypothetical protein
MGGGADVPTFQVHLYKEFSKIVGVEADTLAEAFATYGDELSDDWEESGDEYVSCITDHTGAEVWNSSDPEPEDV